MKTAFIVAVLPALVLCGCGNKSENQDAVKSGIIKGVAKKGVNVEAMNVSLTAVNFHGNRADATAVFTPKGGTAANGLTMHYTLEEHDGEWNIVGRGQMDMQAHTGGATSTTPASPMGASPMPQSGSPIPDLSQTLPPGHPQTGGDTPAPSPASPALPPGHPAIDGSPK